jgi:hypothetical protein
LVLLQVGPDVETLTVYTAVFLFRQTKTYWLFVGNCNFTFSIGLKNIRPKGLPGLLGISSENGAHRIAVEWTEDGQVKEGFFVPRRDTSSLINTIAGGRIFPGRLYHAKFEVQGGGDRYQVAFKSSDGTTISIDAEKAIALNSTSIFGDIKTASSFFEHGSVGYSPGLLVFGE